MPAKDVYHDTVIHALQVDGWTNTHDPLALSYGGRELYVDLGAEHTTVAAQKEGRKIAVEIKSFLSASLVHDLHEAVGQYQVYRSFLEEIEPERPLYLAIAQRIYEGLFAERFGQLILTRLHLQLLVFDEQHERIVAWIP